MKGRKYFEGDASLKIYYIRYKGDKKLTDYVSGISDTIYGSHGFTFHWAPIVILDDCQIAKIEIYEEKETVDKYHIEVEKL